MKKKSGNNLSKILQADFTGLIWNFLRGIWSSFSRFVRRSLYPNQPRTTLKDKTQNPKPTLICPLIGISQFRKAESLTVGDLIAKVQWQTPGKSVNSSKLGTNSSSTSMASVKDQIQWD
jgi:hypothetical protein